MRVAGRSLRRKRGWESASGLAPETCLVCGSDHVHPVDWEASTGGPAWVRLRCGSCTTWREDVFDADTLDRFDRKLTEDEAEIGALAARLHRDWRAAEADTFAAALDRDLIDPDDFAGRVRR